MNHKLYKTCFTLALSCMFAACNHPENIKETSSINPPKELFGDMFLDVLNNDSLFGAGKLFADSKDFMDCTPKKDMKKILEDYSLLRDKQHEDTLTQFILNNFELPNQASAEFSDSSDINTHISKLWKFLRREANNEQNTGTLIPLQQDYIVPGGRFREIYYWDSYFTILGLFADHETELAEDMIRNFADLIDQVGFIPNGNRSYYISRSQPPFFSHMVEAWAENNASEAVIVDYLDEMQKEYDFWIKGSDQLFSPNKSEQHCVLMPDGSILNRYYDQYDTPREEMYRNDVETAEQLKAVNPQFDEKRLFRDLRSGAESGWDFSSRWLKEYDNLYSIHTTDIVPVDLNSLLYHLENMLYKAYSLKGEKEHAETFREKAEKRKRAILKYLWNEEQSFFMDYDFMEQKSTNNFSLAGVYPLYMGIATEKQAALVAGKIKKDFLKDGGVVTTLYETGQQWDYPNGWAPLQWITYSALKNYQHDSLAENIKNRWTTMVEKVYQKTGKLLEKYNVVTLSDTGGGEYPNQDGFGWTNGVYRAFCTSDSLFTEPE